MTIILSLESGNVIIAVLKDFMVAKSNYIVLIKATILRNYNLLNYL